MKIVIFIVALAISIWYLWHTSQPYNYNYVLKVDVYCSVGEADVKYVKGNVETIKISGCPDPSDLWCSIKLKQDIQRIFITLLPLIIATGLVFYCM